MILLLNTVIGKKNIFEISEYKNLRLQAHTVAMFCDKLLEHHIVERVIPTYDHIFPNNYYLMRHGKIINKEDQLVRDYLNSLVYGFKYIYENNRNRVLPIKVIIDGEPHMGTCFKTVCGIVTAEHCVRDAKQVSIPGIPIDILKKSKVLAIDGLDIVVIQFESNYDYEEGLMFEQGNILDDVLCMGYPALGGFDRFLTATTGQIAAIEAPFLGQCKVMEKQDLIIMTGKVKGGNSGGPVLNNKGRVVGVITETTNSEGDYDKFGYGLALPIQYVTEIIKQQQTYKKTLNWVPYESDE